MVTSQTSEACRGAPTCWLGRYGKPTPIRKRGAFTLVSTTRTADGQSCVVLVPGREADPARAAEAFTRIERAHNTVPDACVPAVTARGMFQGFPFLELACDAVMDGVTLHQILIEACSRTSLASADAFASELSRALRAAHEVRDPSTRRPVCIERLSYANLLFAPSGRCYLVGFGHNFPVQKPCGLPDGWVTAFQAPEVAQGRAPSPVGDHIALHQLLRSLLPLIDLGPVLARILFEVARPDEAEILHCLRWPDVHLLAEPPARRGSLAEAEARAERLRKLCGIRPDQDGLTRFVRRAIQGAMAPTSASAGQRTLVVGVETSWVLGSDGARHVLGQAHRRIVTALAELHRCSPGAVLTLRELLEIGWPGERPIPEAGANRVYVALTQLRRMGMRDLIERCEGGYRFLPDVDIHLSR